MDYGEPSQRQQMNILNKILNSIGWESGYAMVV